MGRDDFTCLSCGDSKNTLHVHHTFYESGREPWEYPDESLKTICDNCHKKEHDIDTEPPVKLTKRQISINLEMRATVYKIRNRVCNRIEGMKKLVELQKKLKEKV